METKFFRSAFAGFGCFLAVCALGDYSTPEAGSALRKQLMDTLRAPVTKVLHQKVVFQVDTLRVDGGWAFMSGVNKTPAGNPIDYHGTIFQRSIDGGAFEDWICALFKKSGKGWKVVTYSIGGTDVTWDGWDSRYGCPKDILPYDHLGSTAH